MVWGGTMARFIDRVDVIWSDGVEQDPYIMKGLAGCYRADQRRAILHIKALVPRPDEYPSQFAWAVAHDLAHAFDVAHGNLSFDRETQTLVYMGRRYKLHTQATTLNVPETTRFRQAKYYDAHQYYEPWEVRPLFAADAVMAEDRRDEHRSPNLEEA